MLQALNIAGAVCLLIAFVGLKTNRTPQDSLAYNIANGMGGLLLGIVAVFDVRIGWIIMETLWVGISARAIWKYYERKRKSLPGRITDSTVTLSAGSHNS